MPSPNEVGPANSWRLIHNESAVIALFESAGYTKSVHNIFEASTKEACEAEITRLSLTPLPEEPEE